MLCPLTDRAGINDNFVSLLPGRRRLIPSGLIITLDPLRIRFIGLAPERFNVIRFHK